jgi:hypothetical protein
MSLDGATGDRLHDNLLCFKLRPFPLVQLKEAPLIQQHKLGESPSLTQRQPSAKGNFNRRSLSLPSAGKKWQFQAV